MKLIFCPNCRDVVNLNIKIRYCECRQCWGNYTDNTRVEISDHSILLGIDNQSFLKAIGRRISKGHGDDFKAFVMQNRMYHEK